MLTLLVVTLLCGLLVPVYSDEVGWRFQLSRYFQDDRLDRFIGENCGPGTAASPAMFMLPMRAFSSGVTAFFADPFAVRIAGVMMAVAGVLGLRLLMRRTIADPMLRATLEMMAYALLGIGVLPFLLVWSRPEQPIWLMMVGSLLVAGMPRRSAARAEPAWAILAVLAFALVAFGYHLKALFYWPVFAIALVWSGRDSDRIRLRAAALVMMAVAGAVAFRYWSDRFACPTNPLLEAKLKRENAAILLLGGGWRDFLHGMPRILTDTMLPHDYIKVALPARKYMSHWLPGGMIPTALLGIWRALGWCAWYGALASGAFALAASLRDPERRVAPLMFGVTLICCATGWAALQFNKNAYESALYLPVLVLGLVLVCASGSGQRRWIAVPAWGIAAISVASQFLLIVTYAPPLWMAVRDGGYVAGQPYSLSPYRYPRGLILAAGARCGIVPRPGLRRVLIDDLTYFAYSDSHHPMYRLGVLSDWNGSIRDPLAWMRSQGSPGAVIGCRYLPPRLSALAVATGPYCCFATP